MEWVRQDIKISLLVFTVDFLAHSRRFVREEFFSSHSLHTRKKTFRFHFFYSLLSLTWYLNGLKSAYMFIIFQRKKFSLKFPLYEKLKYLLCFCAASTFLSFERRAACVWDFFTQHKIPQISQLENSLRLFILKCFLILKISTLQHLMWSVCVGSKKIISSKKLFAIGKNSF